jgi:hypothetical protein
MRAAQNLHVCRGRLRHNGIVNKTNSISRMRHSRTDYRNRIPVTTGQPYFSDSIRGSLSSRLVVAQRTGMQCGEPRSGPAFQCQNSTPAVGHYPPRAVLLRLLTGAEITAYFWLVSADGQERDLSRYRLRARRSLRLLWPGGLGSTRRSPNTGDKLPGNG